jgi:hypothetical protein
MLSLDGELLQKGRSVLARGGRGSGTGLGLFTFISPVARFFDASDADRLQRALNSGSTLDMSFNRRNAIASDRGWMDCQRRFQASQRKLRDRVDVQGVG